MVALQEAVRKIFTDDELSDLQLRGKDGSLVNAQRSMLAARSDVFRRMLYGSFAETSQAIVDVGYDGLVLEAVVEFVYSDDAAIFHRHEDARNLARSLVSLTDASHFLALEELRIKVETFTISLLASNSGLAPTFYAACEPYGDSVNGIRDLALSAILSDPGILLLQKSLLSCFSDIQLEKILSNTEFHDTEELLKFNILLAWSTHEGHHAQAEVLDKVNRRSKAAMLSRHISLERIDPKDLSTLVAASGLVSVEDLCTAYKEQALKTSRGINIAMRSCVWRSSMTEKISCKTKSHSTELLQSPVLRRGVHQWSVRIEKMCNIAWIGVASTTHEVKPTQWLGLQSAGWVYGSNGSAYNKNHCETINSLKCPLPKFGKGSSVSMVIDLRDNRKSLYVSTDDGPIFRLFATMSSGMEMDTNITSGFVPAVSLCAPGEVTFLGLRSMSDSDADAILDGLP